MPLFAEGFVLGLAFAAPIGVQNLFVIRWALTKSLRIALAIAAVVAGMDIALGFVCLFGFGSLIEATPGLKSLAFLIGGLFMVVVGLVLVCRRVRPPTETAVLRWSHVVPAAAALTWLNPHALLDGAVLLGAYRARLDGGVSLFAAGLAAASTAWFMTLTTGVNIARRRLPDSALRWVNVGCGLALCGLGVRMLVG